jgi:inosine-uridine nucleoside N-ribohydrolase
MFRLLAAIAATFTTSVAMLAQPSPLAPRTVIVDTDAGPDDLMAIAYLLRRPDVRLDAITISYGLAHQEPGGRNVLRLLEAAGRRDVPVFLGRGTPDGEHHPFPDAWRAEADAMAGVSWPEPSRSVERRPAADFLIERLADRSRPVDVLALGALTNLAEALARSRGAAARSLVIMGGAIDVPGNIPAGGPSANTTAEWNLHADPAAARRVLGSGLPILLVPLDATAAVPIDAAFVRTLAQRATSTLGRLVSQVLATAKTSIDAGHYHAWDPLAAVALTDRRVVTTARVPLSIRLREPEAGRTVRDENGGVPVEVALAADRPRFVEIFLGALAGS